MYARDEAERFRCIHWSPLLVFLFPSSFVLSFLQLVAQKGPDKEEENRAQLWWSYISLSCYLYKIITFVVPTFVQLLLFHLIRYRYVLLTNIISLYIILWIYSMIYFDQFRKLILILASCLLNYFLFYYIFFYLNLYISYSHSCLIHFTSLTVFFFWISMCKKLLDYNVILTKKNWSKYIRF